MTCSRAYLIVSVESLPFVLVPEPVPKVTRRTGKAGRDYLGTGTAIGGSAARPASTTEAFSFLTMLGGRFIDEVRLVQYPILLGGGTPLFADDDRKRQLALVDTERFESGATFQRYR